MNHTRAPADVSHYYQRLAELSTLPFWQRPDITEPTGAERGHVWHWHDVYPELARSRDIVDHAATLQRRALCLRNPGFTPPAIGTTHTLAATYQMLFPGETAPVHAHSMSALRFGLAGTGARMIIDGDRVPLEPGDLVLTPGWSWHGHVHPGSDEPVVWFDGLDVPFVLSLRAGFYRDDPHADSPLPTRDTTGTAVSPATLAPAGDRTVHHSAVRRYPWQEAYPALQRLMARASRHDPITRLEYRNPITGGPALATLACLLEGMPPATQTRPGRETASSVMVVARGTGTLTCGSHTFELHPNDVAAIPAWTWHHLTTSDHELVLFRMTDRPIQDAFGLYRAEPNDASIRRNAAFNRWPDGLVALAGIPRSASIAAPNNPGWGQV
jgi:gentisate 1,2-dioxygenase